MKPPTHVTRTRSRYRMAQLPAPNPRESRQRGLALFIVLVVLFVVSLVTAQLVYTTVVEERIAKSRTGELEMVLAQESAARAAMMRILDDWENDEAGAEDETAGDDSGDMIDDGADDADTPPPVAGGTHFDTRHESWARPYEESLNEVRVRIRIIDAESRININDPWDLAMLPREDDSLEGTEEEDDTDPASEDEGLEQLGDMVDGDDEGEWTPPTPEKEQRTRELLSRLIESIIYVNQANEFDYEETPDPDAAANDIVDWILDRYRRPETRPIRSLEGLRDLDEVTSELFDGPYLDPEEELEQDLAMRGEEDEELLGSGAMPDSLRNELQRLQLGEDFLQDLPQGYEELDEDGLQEIPRPLGLREFLTTISSGSLNLNTTRPELLMALMFHTNDFRLAAERALSIQDYLNSYSREEGEDGEPIEPELDEDGTVPDQEFEFFRSLDDLAKVDEDWAEALPGEDESVVEILKYDFQRMSFSSEYFTAILEAERNGRTLRAELVMHRNSDENRVEVLSWRTLPPR